MPELPEVDTIARELNAALQGQRILTAQAMASRVWRGGKTSDFTQGLKGQVIQQVSRRAKYVLFHLGGARAPQAQDSEAGGLVSHLGMTGKWVLTPGKNEAGQPLPSHARAWIQLEDGRKAVYQDARMFGRLWLAPCFADDAILAALGPEPLEEAFTVEVLARQLRGQGSRPPKGALKPWLLDQRHVAGVGNIYASEILFRAGISPFRPAGALNTREITALHTQIVAVLRAALAANGTTISDYRRVDDKTGSFQHFLQVYDKAGAPCPQCGQPIQRVVQQQRSTFFCPDCQT